MALDLNKSIIVVVAPAQSNGAGDGKWTDKSTTGFYNTYAALESVNIGSFVYTTEYFLKTQFNSNIRGDFQTDITGYENKNGSDATAIGFSFSFVKDLYDYLVTQSYTKNLWILNHALGGTSLQSLPNSTDWIDDHELLEEHFERLDEVIQMEIADGNEVEVVYLYGLNESDAGDPPQKPRAEAVYQKITNEIGYEPLMYIMKIAKQNASSDAINSEMDDWASENDYIFTMDHSNSGGLDQFDWAEANDPDGLIDASIVSSYTNDNVHFNWSMQVLIGKQLYNTFINTI